MAVPSVPHVLNTHMHVNTCQGRAWPHIGATPSPRSRRWPACVCTRGVGAQLGVPRVCRGDGGDQTPSPGLVSLLAVR